jgi:hypothetical protein
MLLGTIALLGLGPRAAWGAGVLDPVFAAAVVDSGNVTAFFGGNVLGPPDRAGLFLGASTDPQPVESPDDMGFLVVRFDIALTPGDGPDLFVLDEDRLTVNQSEQARVFLSSDGVAWGESAFPVTGGTGGGGVDWSDAFSGTVRFVKIVQSSSAALDVDAVQGNFPVPEPGTLALICGGLTLLAGARRGASR